MTQIREFDKVNVESVGVGLLIYLEEDKGFVKFSHAYEYSDLPNGWYPLDKIKPLQVT